MGPSHFNTNSLLKMPKKSKNQSTFTEDMVKSMVRTQVSRF